MNNSELEKRKRFKRLATQRTNEVLDRLRILGNCADNRAYSYSEEEIDKIFRAIEQQTRLMKSKFKKPRKGFKL